MSSFDEMTLTEAANEIRKQKQKVDNAAYWNFDKKTQLMNKYNKLLDAINYLWDNQRYFNNYHFMNEKLIEISQK